MNRFHKPVIYGSITTLEDANRYLQKYGSTACLEEFKKGKQTKFRFVNVPVIARFPYPFKSISTAMNALFYHERGGVQAKKAEKERVEGEWSI